jgi:hypothetical protein
MYRHQSPFDSLAASLSVNPADLGDGATNGASVDMQGYDGVVFMVAVGNITDTVDMKAQDSADNSTFADISGASITQVPNTGDNKIYMLDCWRPSRRYVRPVVTAGGTGATILATVIAVRYRRGGLTPITQDATVGELKKVALN